MRSANLNGTNEVAILNRIIRPKVNELPIPAARAFLQLEFDVDDRARMQELAAKNRADSLTEAEDDELRGYIHVGLILDLLHAKARQSLRRRAKRR